MAVDSWTLVFWRGALVALALGIFLLWRGGWTAFRCNGAIGLAASVLSGVGTVFFVLAITHTKVANALVIIGASPLFAALFSRLFLGEAVPGRTWAAIGCTLVGLTLTVSGSLESGHLLGDACALITGAISAAYFTLLRARPRLDISPIVAGSGVAAALLAAPLAAPLDTTPGDMALLAVLGLIVLPVSFSLIARAPRYIPAQEVGLIMRLETVLGPLWVWLALGEEPPGPTLVGGGLILATLTIHSLVGLRVSKAA
ncbi:MAG: EamA family transporter [Candidatus Latescibacteria bacterium]|nr:EamA family transporter [Candidatus Latescibacterota bacterium]